MLFLLPIGCGNGAQAGGQTGGEVTTICEGSEVERVDSIDAITPLGFSARESLSVVEGRSSAPLVTRGLEGAQLELAPGTEMVATVSYGGGAVELVNPPARGTDGCPTYIRIAVDLELTSSDASLSLRREASVVAQRADVASLTFQPQAGVDGELPTVEPSGQWPELELYMLWAEGVFAGTLVALSSAGHGRALVAQWPDAECPEKTLPLPQDQSLAGHDGDDLIAVVREAAPAILTWADGAISELEEASIEPVTTWRCVSSAGETTFLPAVLTVRSGDGRIDGEWSVVLHAYAPEDQLSGVWLLGAAEGSNLVASAEFADRLGVGGVDVSGYDQAGISLSLNYNLITGTGGNGYLEIVGASGEEFASVAAAQWSTP